MRRQYRRRIEICSCRLHHNAVDDANQEPSMSKQPINTAAAPQAIGTYSQAIRSSDTVYLSGQIGLDPASMLMVEGIEAQIHRVFENLKAVAAAAGGSLDHAVNVTVYLTDLSHFA